jgi:hypothetical protein
MGIGMQNHSAIAPSESNVADLFALSDEQILEIAPETEVALTESPAENQETSTAAATSASTAGPGEPPQAGTARAPSSTSHESPVTGHVGLEPPAWLAAQMQDPWGGEEAREFWDGVQHAKSEAAAYRAAFATPEDARALKELYPGGVSEARAAAERGRLLEEIDRAYFGTAGNSPEQTSASRAQLPIILRAPLMPTTLPTGARVCSARRNSLRSRSRR